MGDDGEESSKPLLADSEGITAILMTFFIIYSADMKYFFISIRMEKPGKASSNDFHVIWFVSDQRTDEEDTNARQRTAERIHERDTYQDCMPDAQLSGQNVSALQCTLFMHVDIGQCF